LLSATFLGSPGPANIRREEVQVSSPENAGEAIFLLRIVPLPHSQLCTSSRLAFASLRSVMRRSLSSMRTGTWKRGLEMLGLLACTSVGPGTASSKADRLGSLSSRGTRVPTRVPVAPPGRRWKYGRP
jgi:hypothetical protein